MAKSKTLKKKHLVDTAFQAGVGTGSATLTVTTLREADPSRDLPSAAEWERNRAAFAEMLRRRDAKLDAAAEILKDHATDEPIDPRLAALMRSGPLMIGPPPPKPDLVPDNRPGERMARVQRIPGLTGNEKSVLTMLAYHDGPGTAKPSWDTLQIECALSRTLVGRALKGLKDKGYITVKRRWNAPSVYTVLYEGKSPKRGLTSPVDNFRGKSPKRGRLDVPKTGTLTGREPETPKAFDKQRTAKPEKPPHAMTETELTDEAKRLKIPTEGKSTWELGRDIALAKEPPQPLNPGGQENAPPTKEEEHEALMHEATQRGIDPVFKSISAIKAAIAAKEKGNGG